MTLFLITAYILGSLKEYFFGRERIELLTQANVIANITSRYVVYRDDTLNQTIEDLKINKDIRVIITDKEAAVLYDTAETNNLRGKVLLKEEVVSALNGKDEVRHYIEDDIGWVINAAVPIIKERETIGVVYLSTYAEVIINFLSDIRKTLFAISFIVSIFIGFLSYILARIITAPVENLTAVIKNMHSGSMNQKVDVRGKDEIAQLRIAFNSMSEHLNQVEEKRREFVSNASHELKTPLSSIKVLTETLLQIGNADLALINEFLNDINHEIDRLSRIINKLLMLTKMDFMGSRLELKELYLKEFLAGILKTLSPLAHQKKIQLELFAQEDIFIKADEDKIWETVFNIVDNSIKYTAPGGKVKVVLESMKKNVQITVEDNGIGIPAEEVDKVFDRFYRIDKARARETGGTGLGLSIALNAVRLHGGDIQVESEEGKGSKFRIILPFSPIETELRQS